MSLQRIMTSSAVRIRAVPPFRIGLSKSTLQDHLEVSVDTITYNYRFVHISAPRIPPAHSCAVGNPALKQKESRQSKSFPHAKTVLLCLVQIAFRPATLPEYLYGQNPKKKKCPFHFRKIHPPRKTKEPGTFFFFWFL